MAITHHFLVVWIINLLNQWELLWTQLFAESRHLSKLKQAQMLRMLLYTYV